MSIRQLQNEREIGPNCDRKACRDCLAGQSDQEMASSTTNELKNVILTDDIPGAKIPRESLEHCRIWRMCPAKQSMHATTRFATGQLTTRELKFKTFLYIIQHGGYDVI